MGEIPTMRHLTEELLTQKEPEAAEIALSLELYTTGSLAVFSGEEAEEPEKRLTVFDISEMEENLKDAGLDDPFRAGCILETAEFFRDQLGLRN